MGLLQSLFGRRSRRRSKAPLSLAPRHCHVETIESRQLLTAAPAFVGAVYIEDDSGSDLTPDRFEVSFVGGAPGSQLKRLVIDGDQDGNGFDQSDMFFDTITNLASRGALQGQAAAFRGDLSDNVGAVTFSVDDGGTKLIIDFEHFDAGEHVVFTVDVDEAQHFDPADTDWDVINGGFDTIASGVEFQTTKLTATIAAPHFYEVTGADTFLNAYDGKFAGKGLELPADNAGGFVNRTAGGVVTLQQLPLPITVSGTVFKDPNLNNHQDASDPGISGVQLELWVQDGGNYVSTGHTAVTDAQGDYRFEGAWLLPGTYRVVETQPAAPYFSVGSNAGTVDGSTRGSVLSADAITDIVLLGGENSIHNDFAEALPGSLSGYVFIDANDNGVRDAGEAGIGGVTVQLLDANGNPTGRTATTSVNAANLGYYIFSDLRPDAYGVAETQPAAFDDGKDQVGSAGGTALAQPGDRITGAIIASEQNALNYNFGELIPPGSLAGYVYSDLDQDCFRDANETGIAGVRVHLLDQTGAEIRSTLTDSNGRYFFDKLPPGMYSVVEDQPNGFYHGGQTVGSGTGTIVGADNIGGIQVTSRVDLVDYNFCEVPPASLSGYVFVDANDNGVRDSGEQGITGVTLRLLDQNGTPTGRTVVTDAQGFYVFDNLMPGKYGVAEDHPAAYDDGKDQVGSAGGVALPQPGDRITGAMLGADVDAVNYNFGELIPPGSLSGFVYADVDGDCLRDQGEAGIAGVTIHLLDAQGNILRTTTTDANGFYHFDDLAPGMYGVSEEQPDGYYHGGQTVGSGTGTIVSDDHIGGVQVTSRVDLINYNFCELPPGTLSGYVYVDQDEDCNRDPGEVGIAGTTIHLLDAQGNTIGTTTTDANGRYFFGNLKPGVYGVREVQPNGFYQGGQSVGSGTGIIVGPDHIGGVQVKSLVDLVEYNFCELPPGGLSGYVYVDQDGDCNRDPGELPIAGVTIKLLNEQGAVIHTTTTDANGFYEFDELPPGIYAVVEEQPSGYYHGGQTVGSGTGVIVGPDHIGSIQVNSAADLINYNFCELPPSSLSGHVYVDLDNDGLLDAGEQRLVGVTLQLLDANGAATGRTTTTDANGFYRFDNLRPGVWGVAEVHPSGWRDGKDTPGSRGGSALPVPGDRITGANLPPGDNATNYNFGERPLTGSLRGMVFSDPNQDCVFNTGDTPIAGVMIELLDASGTIVRVATTDANGNYEFTDLEPGEYAVRERQPLGYFQGSASVGSGGGTGGADLVSEINVTPNGHLVHYDFCEIPAGSISGIVFQDGEPITTDDGLPPANIDDFRDGVLTPDDRRLAGVVVELRNGVNGMPILGSAALPGRYDPTRTIRTVTNSAGYYEFVGLPPGNYGVFEVQPEAYIDARDTAGKVDGQTVGVAVNPHDAFIEELVETLETEHNYDAILRIQLPAGRVSTLNNFSEVLVNRVRIDIYTPTPVTFPEVPAWTATPPAIERLLPGPLLDIAREFHLQSGGVSGYTWHLSVVNAGFPRGVQVRGDVIVQNISTQMEQQAFAGKNLRESSWTLPGATSGTVRKISFGMKHGRAVVGDFNGDGISDIAVFTAGEWFIDINGNGEWDDADLWAKLGHKDDRPVVGDWDGDGKDDIGIFGPAWPGDPRAIAAEPGLPEAQNAKHGKAKNMPPLPQEAAIGARAMKLASTGKIRADLIDHVFHYGTATDEPIVGDWNGDGTASIGIFRDGQWRLDVDGDGKWSEGDLAVEFGAPGDKPVVGDWNGDGVDDLAVYRKGHWIFDTNGNHRIDPADKTLDFGGENDQPVAGDFNGDGTDEPALYHDGVAAEGAAAKSAD